MHETHRQHKQRLVLVRENVYDVRCPPVVCQKDFVVSYSQQLEEYQYHLDDGLFEPTKPLIH